MCVGLPIRDMYLPRGRAAIPRSPIILFFLHHQNSHLSPTAVSRLFGNDVTRLFSFFSPISLSLSLLY